MQIQHLWGLINAEQNKMQKKWRCAFYTSLTNNLPSFTD